MNTAILNDSQELIANLPAQKLNSKMQDEIESYCLQAYKFIENNKSQWQLNFDVDLEVTNHVLRVRIQDNTITNFAEDICKLCDCQNDDGGWGNTRDDSESKIRSTSFCVQMLIRANRILKNNAIKASILQGLNYIVSNQNEDGSWNDPTWHFLDAVSTSVGTLLFVANEDFKNDQYTRCLQKGMEFVVSQRAKDSMWYYKPTGSPVTISAHLLQKCATYYGHSDANDLTITRLIELQHVEGHWDNGNTDHTCDAIRAMMLTASRSKNSEIVNKVFLSAYSATEWLIQISKDIGGGLGDRPHKPAHVERTCDGIDAMLKLKQFAFDNSQMIKYWN